MIKLISNNKINQHIILLITFVFLSTCYFLNQPIDFHCDSATFYNYGSKIARVFYKFAILALLIISLIILFIIKFLKNKKYQNLLFYLIFFIVIFFIFLILMSIFTIKTPFAIHQFSRPPLYPFFLFLTGTYFFDTFNTFIFAQSLLSMISIFLIYSIFEKLTDNKNISFIFSLLFSLTSIPYILIKFVSAEQLMYFLVILTFYSIVSFYKKNNFIFLYLGLLSSIFCWFTKWEGQIVYLSFILFIILYFFVSKKKIKLLKNFLFLIFISLIFLSSWTILRSKLTNDFSTVFKVSNSSMDQSMWRFYSSLPSTINIYEKALNIEKENSGNFLSEISPDQPNGTIIINPSNGEKSTQLFELIEENLNKFPDSFLKLKQPLDEAYKSESQKNIDYFHELFGKFSNNKEIVHNIIYQPNIYYFNYFNQLLIDDVGKNRKDKLYRAAIIEGLVSNPIILLTFINNIFTAYGVDFDKYILYKQNPYASINDNDFLMPYNGGKCAENNLSLNHFNEYKNSYLGYNSNSFFKNIIQFNDSLNDVIRNYFGLLFIVSFIILIFYNFTLFFPLVSIPTSLTFAVSVLVDSPTNSKYEVIIFSSNYILFMYFLFLFYKLMFKKKI